MGYRQAGIRIRLFIVDFNNYSRLFSKLIVQTKMSPILQILICIALLFVVSSFAEILNSEVSQIFDASSSIVRYSNEIKATGVEGGEYELVFDHDWSQRLSFLSVTSKGKRLHVKPPVRYNLIFIS